MYRSEIMRLATRMENHLDKAHECQKRMIESDHPAADNIREALTDNELTCLWDVRSIVIDALEAEK